MFHMDRTHLMSRTRPTVRRPMILIRLTVRIRPTPPVSKRGVISSFVRRGESSRDGNQSREISHHTSTASL